MDVKDIISSGLLELYATGLASQEECQQVESWVTQYPEIATELAAIEDSMEAYAKTYAIKPDASVKEKLFTQINATTATSEATIIPLLNEVDSAKIVSMNSDWKWIAAASILLFIGSLAMNVSLNNKNNLANQNAKKVEERLALLEEKNKTAEENLALVQNKFTAVLPLQGLEVAPTAAAKVFWVKNTGQVYIDPTDLPEAPTGKQYQLWAIVDGKPVSAGMIASDKDNKNKIQKMQVFEKAEAFAVSLESEAGNTSPKGTVYVMGKVVV